MPDTNQMAAGLVRYWRMLSNATYKTQAAVDRYGTVLFNQIDRLKPIEQAAVFKQARLLEKETA